MLGHAGESGDPEMVRKTSSDKSHHVSSPSRRIHHRSIMAEEVANAFIQHFYTTLDSNPSNLLTLYVRFLHGESFEILLSFLVVHSNLTPQ